MESAVIARFLAWLHARKAARIEALANAAVEAFGSADYRRAQRLIARVRRLRGRPTSCARKGNQGRACSCSDFQPT
jgi:hypothetical protein